MDKLGIWTQLFHFLFVVLCVLTRIFITKIWLYFLTVLGYFLRPNFFLIEVVLQKRRPNFSLILRCCNNLRMRFLDVHSCVACFVNFLEMHQIRFVSLAHLSWKAAFKLNHRIWFAFIFLGTTLWPKIRPTEVLFLIFFIQVIFGGQLINFMDYYIARLCVLRNNIWFEHLIHLSIFNLTAFTQISLFNCLCFIFMRSFSNVILAQKRWITRKYKFFGLLSLFLHYFCLLIFLFCLLLYDNIGILRFFMLLQKRVRIIGCFDSYPKSVRSPLTHRQFSAACARTSHDPTWHS